MCYKLAGQRVFGEVNVVAMDLLGSHMRKAFQLGFSDMLIESLWLLASGEHCWNSLCFAKKHPQK